MTVGVGTLGVVIVATFMTVFSYVVKVRAMMLSASTAMVMISAPVQASDCQSL